jgi:NitT/TauT family transport system substrate-binding protein
VTTFRISAHGRLQDWIADEKGYFGDEGLDYEIDVRLLENADQDIRAPDRTNVRTGAYELYLSGGGGKKAMSCACHWAVNQAATNAAGRMWGHAYSVLPSAVYAAPTSDIHRPEDLAGVPVSVGYHSGSHFSTIQALESFMDPADITLDFTGMPYDRVDALLDGSVAATGAWGAAMYLLEQRGCRKIVDTTFVAGFMFSSDTDAGDVERYFNALKRAQTDLDMEPERYKHHYLREIPARFHDQVDVRRFGPGERVVFLPYTREMYESAQRWMQERRLFEPTEATPDYDAVVQV